MNEFKIYTDSFKNATVADLFGVSDLNLLKNDNEGLEHVDVLTFGEDSAEFLKKQRAAKSAAENEQAFFAPVPNSGENELTKARLLTFQ